MTDIFENFRVAILAEYQEKVKSRDATIAELREVLFQAGMDFIEVEDATGWDMPNAVGRIKAALKSTEPK